MKARFVSEAVDFERGQDPKKAMGIGIEHAIHKWFDEMFQSFKPDYHINPDYTINVRDFDVPDKKIGRFPDFINFYSCTDEFMIDFCEMEDLRGCPYVCKGYFSCENNNLHSLDGAPKEVYGDFFCRDNPGQFTKADVEKICKVHGKIYSEDSNYDQ